MIFLDSWVWLEYLLGGDRDDTAEDLIERATDEGGLIAPTVIAEVSYRVRAVQDESAAVEAVSAIRDFERIRCPPLVDEVAEYAAAFRFQHYDRGERDLSYADAIHLATAAVHEECHALYSGDPTSRGWSSTSSRQWCCEDRRALVRSSRRGDVVGRGGVGARGE